MANARGLFPILATRRELPPADSRLSFLSDTPIRHFATVQLCAYCGRAAEATLRLLRELRNSPDRLICVVCSIEGKPSHDDNRKLLFHGQTKSPIARSSARRSCLLPEFCGNSSRRGCCKLGPQAGATRLYAVLARPKFGHSTGPVSAANPLNGMHYKGVHKRCIFHCFN